MGRSRKGFKKSKKENLDSDEEIARESDPDPKSRSYIYDEVDEFHAEREKVLLDSRIQNEDLEQSEEEEVLGLSLSEDDDEDGDGSARKYDFAAHHKLKYDMASDLEDENDIPDSKAWGTDKSTFYDTDYVDKAYETYNASDEELAEAEEAEARAIQHRLTEQLDEVDFGLDLFKRDVKTSEKKAFKVQKDVSLLSKQDRLEILKRESPEFVGLVSDLKDKLREIRDQTEPLIMLVKEGKIPPGTGADYVIVKHHLLLNYCTNLCFYLVLKANKTPLTHHPIIQRLVDCIKLLKELEPVGKQLIDEIAEILKCLKNGTDVTDVLNSFVQRAPKMKKRLLQNSSQEIAIENFASNESQHDLEKPAKKKKVEKVTFDETEALRLYQRLKDAKAFESYSSSDELVNPTASDTYEEEDEDVEGTKKPGSEDVADNNDVLNKRAITDKIAKNRGLVPYRKKALRNVRVKNKLKYRKLQIRRKGQVQEVRKELNKYGGEIYGIKASSSRSVKFK